MVQEEMIEHKVQCRRKNDGSSYHMHITVHITIFFDIITSYTAATIGHYKEQDVHPRDPCPRVTLHICLANGTSSSWWLPSLAPFLIVRESLSWHRCKGLHLWPMCNFERMRRCLVINSGKLGHHMFLEELWVVDTDRRVNAQDDAVNEWRIHVEGEEGTVLLSWAVQISAKDAHLQVGVRASTQWRWRCDRWRIWVRMESPPHADYKWHIHQEGYRMWIWCCISFGLHTPNNIVNSAYPLHVLYYALFSSNSPVPSSPRCIHVLLQDTKYITDARYYTFCRSYIYVSSCLDQHKQYGLMWRHGSADAKTPDPTVGDDDDVQVW